MVRLQCCSRKHCLISQQALETLCEICSKLAIKTPERHKQHRSVVFSSLRLEGEETLKYCCVCRSPCGIVYYSNDHGITHKCDYSVFDRKFAFRANLVKKKKKIVGWSENLVSRLTWIRRIQWGYCSLFPFLTWNTPFGETWSKKSKLFKLKFGTYTNSNMQNSVVVFIFSGKTPFLSNFA